ncbi:MAG TPA: sulfatase, partial [Candidatus Acidoferrum sp.]|nr:sulfatase [Candidatus Acidoferrum sp.]
YGDAVMKTPAFDRIAREGALFNYAFCAAPSCTASRGAILTGLAPHQLESGGNLWSTLPAKFETFPDTLERAGYFVGLMGKGWGPGDVKSGGRTRNPAGPPFKSFEAFLEKRPPGKPFCFWFGSVDPHRPYERGTGTDAGLDANKVRVPAFWPDKPEVREDMLDYYFEVERLDRNVTALIATLEKRGELENTVIIYTSDNGMPFPRAKANLYDAGTRMPLAIRWPGKTKPGTKVDAFVNLYDLAPTILELSGVAAKTNMTGRSIVPLLTGSVVGSGRESVFVERERHANVRAGDLSYPSRAVRSKDYLYIRNFAPDRWPAGDPVMWKAVGEFGDCDNGATKSFILEHREQEWAGRFFDLCFGMRPGEEFYDLRNDPDQLTNVVKRSEFGVTVTKHREWLANWMKQTADPRAIDPADDRWDRYEYFGDAKRMPPKTEGASSTKP